MKISEKPAVFLDRDGVLTKEIGYVTASEHLHLFPYAEDCISRIHEKGYYAVVVTNQSGVARGLFTEAMLQEMNQYLMEQTGTDAVYYCPHHPQGKVERYRKVCRCRKPGIGMFEKARREFAIDMQNSWMVGDRAGDILAGQRAGLRTVLLESGYGSKRLEEPVKPDYTAEDLREFLNLL